MAMVYSLMSTIEETLTSYNLDLAKSKPLLQAKRQEEISERQVGVFLVMLSSSHHRNLREPLLLSSGFTSGTQSLCRK